LKMELAHTWIADERPIDPRGIVADATGRQARRSIQERRSV